MAVSMARKRAGKSTSPRSGKNPEKMLYWLYMNIWLDDQLNEPDLPKRHTLAGWVGVRNFDEFKKAVEGARARKEPIEIIDFDNDLCNGEAEGYKILEWLGSTHPEYIVEGTDIRLHAENTVRKEWLENYITQARKHKEEFLAIHGDCSTHKPHCKA